MFSLKLRNKKDFEFICKKRNKNKKNCIFLRAKIIEYLEKETHNDISNSCMGEKIKIAFIKEIPKLLKMIKSVEKC